jgi:hypothetical protein
VATTLSTIQARSGANANVQSADDLGDGKIPVSAAKTVTYAYSAAAGALNVSLAYLKRRTVTAAGTITLDLNALTDRYGVAINFALVKTIRFYNRSATLPLTVKFPRGAGGNSLCDALFTVDAVDAGNTFVSMLLPAGGTRFVDAPTAAGFAVGASDTIVLGNAGGSDADVDISLLGQ